MVNALLAAGANPNPPDDDDVPSPALQEAISSDARSEHMVKLLLQHRADVNAIDDQGQTALHKAVRHGTVGIVDLLVEAGAAVDGSEDDLMYPSPLHVACGTQRYSFLQVTNCDVIKALLGHGASVNLRDEGNTPLHYAAKIRSTKMVDFLLRAGADESIANHGGRHLPTESEAYPLGMLASKNGPSPC